jgi:hypothetical protein
MWACQYETKGYTGANCGGRIRTAFPDMYVIVFLHVLFCRESEEFPDKIEAEYFYSVWTSERI